MTSNPRPTRASPQELFGSIHLKGKVPEARLIDLAIDKILQYSSRAVVFVRTHTGIQLAASRKPPELTADGQDDLRWLSFDTAIPTLATFQESVRHVPYKK
jgi:hypothetical protein